MTRVPQQKNSRGNPELITFEDGSNMTPVLGRHHMHLYKLLAIACVTPWALLLVLILLPTAMLTGIATLFGNHFWILIKPIQLEACEQNCRFVALSAIAVPLCWMASAFFAIVAAPAGLRFRRAQADAIRHGAAPNGILPDGHVRPLNGPGTVVLLGVVVLLLVGGFVVLAFESLYVAGGANRTFEGRTGRALSAAELGFLLGVMMSVLQGGVLLLSFVASYIFETLASLMRD